MKPLLLIMAFMFLAVSCAQQSDSADSSAADSGYQPQLNCSAAPPIEDKSRLIKMLKDNGTISPEMNKQQIEQIVSDYIKRKNKKHKECK